ncbi:hypothetical protein C0V97_00860 [Asaia sp. W19]|uniref:Hint domain-containing protein n=1 Tax=unclassified Asaia TaxID=2685023 RepID=UPI000F8CA16B|nr:Hint domain-containing protein [Asaia sp. W19]RUT27506.1 hypothetical protein C0V97_00860 [Asaia sp. W19]
MSALANKYTNGGIVSDTETYGDSYNMFNNGNNATLRVTTSGQLLFEPVGGSSTVNLYGDLANSGTISFRSQNPGPGNIFNAGTNFLSILQQTNGNLVFDQTNATGGASIYLQYGVITNDSGSTIDLEAAGASTISAPYVHSLSNAGTIKIVDTSGTGMTSNWGAGGNAILNNTGKFTIDDSDGTTGATINFNFQGGIINRGVLSLNYPVASTVYLHGGNKGVYNSGTLSFASGSDFGATVVIDGKGLANNGVVNLTATSLRIGDGDVTGVGSFNLSDGSSLALSAANTAASGQTFNFSGGDNRLDISSFNTAGMFSGKIRGFSAGDQLYTGVTGDLYYDRSSGILTLSTAFIKYTYDVGKNYGGTFSDSILGVITYSGDTPCYLAGTMIRTPDGEVAVETIESGDSVLVHNVTTGEQAAMRVVWVGSRTVTVLPKVVDDESGAPIRIRKDAFDIGSPSEDLLVTAEHCVLLDRAFIPARMLVNGRSIFYDRSFHRFPVYHIETEKHSVLIANDVLSESFLNTGNHAVFRRVGRVVPARAPQVVNWDEAAAPLCVAREFVEPIYRSILARAKSVGFAPQAPLLTLNQDADLRLETDGGEVIRPARMVGSRAIFRIPPRVENVRIVSNASRPCDVVGPFVDDRRKLGVLVGDVTIYDRSSKSEITAHLSDDTLMGWCAVDAEDRRWTSGNAQLSLQPYDASGVAILAIEIISAGPYVEPYHTDHFRSSEELPVLQVPA